MKASHRHHHQDTTSEQIPEDYNTPPRAWSKTARFGLETIWPLLAIVTAMCFISNESKADSSSGKDAGLSIRDPGFDSQIGRQPAPRFSVPFKPLTTGPAVLEAIWQTENIVDLRQTLRIANEPARYREVGTLGVFCGQHPSARQVWIGSLVAGALHYGVAQLLENAGYTKSLAAFQLVTLGHKTWNVERNERIGLGR